MIFQNFGFNSITSIGPSEQTLFIEWLLVGGGGSSGLNSSFNTGGGGAGRFVSSSAFITPQSASITIGLGGAQITASNTAGENGGDSEMILNGTTYTSPGGGGGGSYSSSYSDSGNGKNGGSGGGCSEEGTFDSFGGDAIEGTPIAGFGNDAERRTAGTQAQGSTAGAGAGSAGTTTSAGLSWLDGITYCVGGPQTNASQSGSLTAGSGGKGGIISSGVSSSYAGQNGICKIRYSGSPVATGGTITQSGGYTYHEFTSSGTFVY